MSIINDALKKAAEKNNPLSQNDSHRKRWLFWVGTGTALLLAVFAAANVFKGPANSVSIQEIASGTDVSQGTFQFRAVDMEMPLELADFRLSGILYDQKKPLAIINKRILGEGALINGAYILEIQPDYVRLSRKDKEFTLKVK